MDWWNAALPVVSVIIGYSGTLITESRRDARARDLAAAERGARLVETRAAERRAFELETLNSAQTGLARLVRAAGQAHHADYMASKAAGVNDYPVTQLPEDINDEVFEANRELARLEGLVISDEARSRVSEFRSAVSKLSSYRGTVDGAERLVLDVVNTYESAVAAVTSRVRGIYDGSVTF
jgi:hypothetical protein